MYVDRLDIGSVIFTEVGGRPAAHPFAIVVLSDEAIKAVLMADRKSDDSFGKLEVSSFFVL